MEKKKNVTLPEELVHEILLRLPVKELLRCKCVSKTWCALIESPSFVDMHFGHESNQDCLLFQLDNNDNFSEETFALVMYEDEERPSRVEVSNHLLQIPNSTRMIALLGPSNGVFCAVSDHGPRVVLLNPATREFKPLPPLPYDGDPFVLAFGFGLDPSSGDYKVVAFQRQGKSPNFICVYNLSSDSWKRIEDVDPLSSIKFVCESKCEPFLNGVYHWHADLVNNGGLAILAFDMRVERFEVIQVPECLKSGERELRITAYDDSLAVLSYKVEGHVDLWVMGRDEFWSKSFTVGPFENMLLPHCVWKKNAMILELEFITASASLIRYDISTHKVREVVPELDNAEVHRVFSYKESLISIKGKADGADCVQELFVRGSKYWFMNAYAVLVKSHSMNFEDENLVDSY